MINISFFNLHLKDLLLQINVVYVVLYFEFFNLWHVKSCLPLQAHEFVDELMYERNCLETALQTFSSRSPSISSHDSSVTTCCACRAKKHSSLPNTSLTHPIAAQQGPLQELSAIHIQCGDPPSHTARLFSQHTHTLTLTALVELVRIESRSTDSSSNWLIWCSGLKRVQMNCCGLNGSTFFLLQSFKPQSEKWRQLQDQLQKRANHHGHH